MTEMKEKPPVSREAMTAIIVAGIVAVICILACTGVMLTFIMNAPWR